jgi:hypothetical protein
MIGHELKRIQFNPMNIDRFLQYPLERFKVGVLVKDRGAKIPAVKGVIQSACFVGAGWSGHVRSPRQRKT